MDNVTACTECDREATHTVTRLRYDGARLVFARMFPSCLEHVPTIVLTIIRNNPNDDIEVTRR
jgi:hypothetical protein